MVFRIILFLSCWGCFSQNTTIIKGTVVDKRTDRPIPNSKVFLKATAIFTDTNLDGGFTITTDLRDSVIVIIKAKDYVVRRFPVVPQGGLINLGVIGLTPDIAMEQVDNLITLTADDLETDEGIITPSSGVLQATRDVFLSKAAFDFGQAFFRVRGYDSKEGQVLLNGMVMNKLIDGRPQWNNWGGLNDIVRNQVYSNGLEATPYTFGGIMGNTNIDTRPSGHRRGTRLSASFANRTYSGRLMATYNSGRNAKGTAFAISASRRWAQEGFIDGTLYNAYSLFGAWELQINPKNTLLLTTILAKNRRGRSAAITNEVFELQGNTYNPYWGMQEGKLRNSRVRSIFEPIATINHFFESNTLQWTSAAAYQTGRRSKSRLGYYNASNPDPTYYRYLPSFYINSPLGADFTNAVLAQDGFLANPQIDWPSLYQANQNPTLLGEAVYVLEDDITEEKQWSFLSRATLHLGANVHFDFGIDHRALRSRNYAEILDLLGAKFHEDRDPFSDTLNDTQGSSQKAKGDPFKYNYQINATSWNGFGQVRYNLKKWNGFLAIQGSRNTFQRKGLYQNERYLNNSLGPGEALRFSTYSFKSGLSYQWTGRHNFQLSFSTGQRPPTLQNSFVNPRENHSTVPDLQSETYYTADFNYIFRLPDLKGRLTGFYTRFQNTTDVNFFFVDTGIGSDFVQEVLTELDLLHKGIEIGIEYQVSPQVTLSLAANYGSYQYASNPNVNINFDTVGTEETLINTTGNAFLGSANIKDLYLAQGPQTALSFGISYRDPKYWWVGATSNYLAKQYTSIATINRTESFRIDPSNGLPFPEATAENVAELLRQQPLSPIYLLNLVGGKSWLINRKYLSVFLSINNAFDNVFKTGGYEQSRNGNFGQLRQDNLSNNPSFGSKYWYGFGRTFFLNFAISF
ncbi:MAG: TonB-dependent receptor [Bacteroidota bacterium]